MSGNLRDGCDSILVSTQVSITLDLYDSHFRLFYFDCILMFKDTHLREDDGLCWLQFTCSKKNGGGALSQSYSKELPIRVFRSSELDNPYAPIPDDEEQVFFRYDGLYNVKAMWDELGNETEKCGQDGESQYTFFLTRLPKQIVENSGSGVMHYNNLGLHELWNDIQSS